MPDTVDAPPQVSLATPGTAGTVDTRGHHLDVVATSDSPAENVTISRLADGELATTTVHSVPIGERGRNASPEASPPLTTASKNPGPATATVTSVLLPATATAWTPSFAYTVSATRVSFAWYSAVGDFEVWEDSQRKAASRSGLAEVGNLVSGSTHEFELRGTVSSAEGDTPSSRSVVVLTHPANSARTQASVTPMTYQQYTTAISYRTFIQPAQVDASMCNWLDTSYTFDGDGRSWSLPGADEPFQTPNYRTLMFANINWGSPAPYDVIASKNVGKSVTRRYGIVVNTAYANMDQMLFQEISSSSGYAQVRFNHRASNPHCKFLNINYGGSIQYNVMFRVYRSGTVEAVGWRKPVPNHEIYLRWNRSDGTEFWKSFQTRGNSGFNCLLDNACALDNYNNSMSY